MIIAQLTDLHIKEGGKLAYKKVDTLSCLRNTIDFINDLFPVPDYLVITGDLGDFGTPGEYDLIKGCLSKCDIPILAVPGNHDDRYNLRARLSEIIRFEGTNYCNFYEEKDEYVLIGLDSSVIGKPYGFLATETLCWLNNKLKSLSRHKKAMLFMHHPPMNVGITHMDVQKLVNPESLKEIISQYDNVMGICVGHLHRPIMANWNSIPVWVGPSHSHSVTLDLEQGAPSSFSLEPRAIQLFNFEEDSVVSHISYIEESDGPHPFFDLNGQLID